MATEKIISTLGLLDKVLSIFGKIKSLFIYKKKKTLPYYFEEYNKKVFVKENGDGIIVVTLELHVNDPINTTHIIRTFDISDAKKDTIFPDFVELLNTGSSDPFSSYGLWYCSENDIVTDICEEYDEKDFKEKDNKKFLSFKLIFNNSDLKPGKTYRISYALSVPGLYPILNGRFDGTVDEHKKYGKFRTSVSTRQTHEKITYSIYTQKGIVFSDKPKAYLNGESTGGKPKSSPCRYRNNMFYEKTNFTLENPQEYDIIYLQWDLKNQLQNP